MSSLSGILMSPQQRQLWRQCRAKATPVSRVLVRLNGALEVAQLQKALELVVAQHESLRTRLELPKNMSEPLQILADGVLHWQREQTIDEDKNLDRLAIFQSEQDVHAMLSGSGENHDLLLQLPAYGCDSTSLTRLVFNIFEVYGALLAGEDYDEEPVQYSQYCAWLQGLEDEDQSAGKGFWVDLRAQLQPASAFPSLGKKSEDGAMPERVCLEGEPLAQLANALQACDDAESFALAGWSQVLAGHLGGAMPPIGVACSGRSFEELETTLGAMTRFLPIQGHPPSQGCFQDLVTQISGQLEQVRPWQEAFDLVQNNLRDTLYGFSCPNHPGSFRLGPLVITARDLWATEQLFQLKLEAFMQNGLKALNLSYDPQLLTRDEATALLGRVVHLLNAALEAPTTALQRLALIGEAERERLLFTWNQAAGPSLVAPDLVTRFRTCAQQQREMPALIFQTETTSTLLSYAALDQLSDQLAAHLQHLGARPGRVVGLFFERGHEMIIGLLATLKAGCAYVALDISWPSLRVNQVLEIADADWVLTHAAAPALETTRTRVHVDTLDFATCPALKPVPTAGAEQLAYLVFTSGSTGEPKGVVVAHGQIRHYLGAVVERLGLVEGLHFGLVSTLAADLGNTCVYPALFAGGCLQVFSRAAISGGEAMARALAQHPIDVLKITPSHLFALLMMESPERILPRRLLVLGGEATEWHKIAMLRALQPKLAIFNHYGPSETTVGVISGALTSPESYPHIPLGKPLAGVQLYVLDAFLQPVPTGATGELFIGGGSVAQGYRGRAAQTAARFIPNPFQGSGERLYRTGDLVRSYGDGSPVFIGRADHQIKLGGYRIELGEIEAVLKRDERVAEVVVIALDDNQIAAFVSPRSGRLDADSLRQFAHSYLPDYMMPGRFVVLDALPLNANGKIDRKALAALKLESSRRPAYEAPQTPLQQALAQVWEEVLRVEHVGLADDFFALGGQSLASIQVINKMQRQVSKPITLTDVFMHPTLAQMAQFLDEGSAESASLVCLCEASSASALFLVHPSGGEVHWYHRLAQLVKQRYRCYGIQAPGLLDPRAISTDLAEIAASYIAMIRAEQPEGPYTLGGWSLGGSIALEMAQQLEQAGEQVEEVILIDAYHMAEKGRDKITQYALLDFISEYTNLWTHQNLAWAEELSQLAEPERLPNLVRKLNSLDMITGDVDIADLERKFSVYLANRRAVAGYEPSAYAGRVRLIRARMAQEGIEGSGPDDPFEETYGWRRFGMTNLVVLNVQGNHYSIFADENIEELAHTLAWENAYQPSTALWFASHLKLKETLGIGPVDRVLRGIVGIFEASFPGRIHGYYVVGSFAEGRALEESDLDIFIIFRNQISASERNRAMELGGHCSYFYPQGIDITIYGESMMYRLALPLHPVKLIYGAPYEHRPEKMVLDNQLRITMYSSLTFIRRVRAFADYMHFPLSLPDPDSTYFGYAERSVLDKDGNYTKNTRELMTIYTRLARAWALYKTGKIIVSKRAIPTLFREAVDAGWGETMQEMLTLCRDKLRYELPEQEEDRQALRSLCRRLVDFENAFLETFRTFLFEELVIEGVTVPWFSVRELVEWLGIPESLLMKQIAEGKVASREQFGEQVVFLPKVMRFFAIKFLAHVIFPDTESETRLQAYLNDEYPLQRFLAETALVALHRQKTLHGHATKALAPPIGENKHD